jgi:hypothetical protein
VVAAAVGAAVTVGVVEDQLVIPRPPSGRRRPSVPRQGCT